MEVMRDLPYSYRNQSTTLTAVTGDFCPACGESVLGAEESARVSTAMLEFNKRVDVSRIL
ncbi:type II toxin-antitoxin system MqsA family antitoxin [Pseudomonas wadenswilerensis]